jgi:AraC-like DNA-binding protein
MHYIFKDAIGAKLKLIKSELTLNQLLVSEKINESLTIAWNAAGEDQKIKIDGIHYPFPSGSVVPLMANQYFSFERPANIVLWQFNRDFYCIIDHDKEVSCAGFLFYGLTQALFIRLDPADVCKITLLKDVFVDEFNTQDQMQGEMLRMLTKRLIILLTRLAKIQYLSNSQTSGIDFNLLRSFNLLVESHFRNYHQVQQYARILNKSPKSLANLFARYNHGTPLQVIHNRITMESKRLLYYTDKTTKEIAYELGFDEVSHFSRFFKNGTGLSPQQFKNLLKAGQVSN